MLIATGVVASVTGYWWLAVLLIAYGGSSIFDSYKMSQNMQQQYVPRELTVEHVYLPKSDEWEIHTDTPSVLTLSAAEYAFLYGNEESN